MNNINCSNFTSELNVIVGRLERADQLTDELALKVNELVQKLMFEVDNKTVRDVTYFEMKIVQESVRLHDDSIEVFACLDGKSENYLFFCNHDEIPEKRLYCDELYFERKKRVC